MSSYAQWIVTTANQVISKTINILTTWSCNSTSAQRRIALENTGIPSQNRRATTNSAGGIARPSCEQGITWSQAQAKSEESGKAS